MPGISAQGGSDRSARNDVAECLDGRVNLYPVLIEKEDKRFLLPAIK